LCNFHVRNYDSETAHWYKPQAKKWKSKLKESLQLRF
jgi:hypothetical protein